MTREASKRWVANNVAKGLCRCGHEPVLGKSRCKKCEDSTKNTVRKRKYGITTKQFDAMVELQNNRCTICNIEFTTESKNTVPHIDHDHKSDKVRSLLCGHCNVGLGAFKDNTTLLLNAISYLMHYQEKLEKETINGSN